MPVEPKKVWIELLCSVANPRRGWDKGEILEWDEHDAARMVERGVARPASKVQIEAAKGR